jgi:hypothetical protein
MLSYSFSFPSFPKFHRVVPLLQTCSASEFVYDHVWFCVYLLGLSSMYERKPVAFVVLNLAGFTLTWCPPIASIHLYTTCHYS